MSRINIRKNRLVRSLRRIPKHCFVLSIEVQGVNVNMKNKVWQVLQSCCLGFIRFYIDCIIILYKKANRMLYNLNK